MNTPGRSLFTTIVWVHVIRIWPFRWLVWLVRPSCWWKIQTQVRITGTCLAGAIGTASLPGIWWEDKCE